MTAPSPEAQLNFLANLQRLLNESSFSATYKFALLLSLANEAIEQGDDWDSQVIPTERLGEQFIRLYWRQAGEFRPSSGRAIELKQNKGPQVAVVKRILEAQQQAKTTSFQRLRGNSEGWSSLLGKVTNTVEEMPLWKLQDHKAGRDFLYPKTSGDKVVLREGVAFCFRRFRLLVQDTVQGKWVRFVRETNAAELGHLQELEDFLFGTPREALTKYRDAIVAVEGDGCFYCSKPISVGEDFVVDHFIPWTLYSLDLGHNFVLADSRCNGNKSYRLAAIPYLERWWARGEDGKLTAAFDKAGLRHDLVASRQVARWAYEQAERAQEQLWLKGSRDLVGFTGSWRMLAGW